MRVCVCACASILNQQRFVPSFCKAATASYSAVQHAAQRKETTHTHAVNLHATTPPLIPPPLTRIHTACIHVRSMLHNLSSYQFTQFVTATKAAFTGA